ncbi:ComF family protein [uncultured Campylobacter sp.]|uniref:ComF family protein n=1 Tax=uncultured Campylobacter sp. TaxID=218934 RepID=UPI00263489C0|nr:ComF family protein [uncultured Campylobacter sp.]
MRCYNCHSFTLLGFCEDCIKELSDLSLGVRKLDDDFKVYSFYKHSEIKHLLYSKHKFYGYFVLNALAKLSFAKFVDLFSINFKVNAVALDDRVENFLYSHSAILTKHLKSKFVKPKFAVLQAQSNIKYSGKNIEFRLKNKRSYKLLKQISSPVILVDDVVTSGSSLLEARNFLKENGIETLFALVLADAKE